MDIAAYRKRKNLTQAHFAQILTEAGQPATQGLISQWERADVRVPAERCAGIEAATGGAVSRHDLRPDVFGAVPKGRAA